MKGKFVGLVILLFWATSPLLAVDLDEVYRHRGKFRLMETPKLKLFYPASVHKAVPRIFSTLLKVRERMDPIFPNLRNFQAKVILTDHDDRDSGSADSIFDLISIGIFEETDSLSTRGYSIEQRFAFRLAYIMVLRSLGSSKTALKRRIAMLSIPPWFLDGLAMHYAFPMEALHAGRLLEMARSGNLFTLNQMDTIWEHDVYGQEQMLFQARAMIDFWHDLAGPEAGKKFLALMSGRPAGFAQTFSGVFKLSIQEGFRKFSRHVKEICEQKECKGFYDPEYIKDLPKARFFQSARKGSESEWYYVSSSRYREEVYDLFGKKPGKRVALLLKNVHPSFLIEPDSGNLFIGKYIVNSAREKRLTLWKVGQEGKSSKISSAFGSFKPLGIFGRRLFFLNVDHGVWSARSLTIDLLGEEREEVIFPRELDILDIEMDPITGDFFLVIKEGPGTSICRLVKADGKEKLELLYHHHGLVRTLKIREDGIWFAAESDFRSLQLFRLAITETGAFLEKMSSTPGGIWDFSNLSGQKILVTTITKEGFGPAFIEPKVNETQEVPLPVNFSFEPKEDLPINNYVTAYKSSYWLPKLSRDDQGGVWGIYSYRADTLDRNRIVVSPTYGLKSKNWGYQADLMKRFDLWKTGLTLEDEVVRKSYRSNSYYERVRALDLHLQYPLSLSSNLTIGANLTKRAIAKFPDRSNLVPSVGGDHSAYFQVNHRGIRTEPYWDLFPRKGRRYTATYKKGLDWLNGELVYDSMSMFWEEYLPINSRYVVTLRGWLAEDDKEGGVRRPEDLTLGGSNFLRGYPGSVRYGDSLRAFSVHLGRPIHFSIPQLRNWIQKEFIVAEAFWERGDVRSAGRRFDFLEDAGFEVRARGLIFRRLPIVVRYGAAWPRGAGKSHSYWAVDFSAVTGLIK